MPTPRSQLKDPSKLTPQEETICALWRKGMSSREISVALGGRPSPSNVSLKLTVIKEKLACMEQASKA